MAHVQVLTADSVTTEQVGTLRCTMQVSPMPAVAADAFRACAPPSRRQAGGRPPPRHRGVSRYRVFMLAVFCTAVLADACAARYLSPRFADVVGSASLVIWAATLLGSFGVGPLGRLRDAIDVVD